MSKPETKTDLPRTDAPPKTDAPQPPFAIPGFPGMPGFQAMQEASAAWLQAARGNYDKLQRSINAYWDELSGYENAMYERARATTNDLASLTQESISYVAALSAELRRMSLEATRRMTDSFKA